MTAFGKSEWTSLSRKPQHHSHAEDRMVPLANGRAPRGHCRVIFTRAIVCPTEVSRWLTTTVPRSDLCGATSRRSSGHGRPGTSTTSTPSASSWPPTSSSRPRVAWTDEPWQVMHRGADAVDHEVAGADQQGHVAHHGERHRAAGRRRRVRRATVDDRRQRRHPRQHGVPHLLGGRRRHHRRAGLPQRARDPGWLSADHPLMRLTVRGRADERILGSRLQCLAAVEASWESLVSLTLRSPRGRCHL